MLVLMCVCVRVRVYVLYVCESNWICVRICVRMLTSSSFLKDRLVFLYANVLVDRGNRDTFFLFTLPAFHSRGKHSFVTKTGSDVPCFS